MGPQREIKLWLCRKLDARGRGSRAALATALGVTATAMSRMTHVDPDKEQRGIKAHELVEIIRFFGESPPDLKPAATSIDTELAVLPLDMQEELRGDFLAMIDRRKQKTGKSPKGNR